MMRAGDRRSFSFVMSLKVLWVLQDLRWDLSQALELTGAQSRDVWKLFWSAQQRFFKLLCISMKARLLHCFQLPCSCS